MDYATQCLIEEMGKICTALEHINDQLERLNENIENITGSFKNRSFINVSATVSET